MCGTKTFAKLRQFQNSLVPCTPSYEWNVSNPSRSVPSGFPAGVRVPDPWGCCGVRARSAGSGRIPVNNRTREHHTPCNFPRSVKDGEEKIRRVNYIFWWRTGFAILWEYFGIQIKCHFFYFFLGISGFSIVLPDTTKSMVNILTNLFMPRPGN